MKYCWLVSGTVRTNVRKVAGYLVSPTIMEACECSFRIQLCSNKQNCRDENTKVRTKLYFNFT